MTTIEPKKAVGSSLFEDLERMSLSLNRAFPNSETHRFDHLLKALDLAEERSSQAGHIKHVSK